MQMQSDEEQLARALAASLADVGPSMPSAPAATPASAQPKLPARQSWPHASDAVNGRARPRQASPQRPQPALQGEVQYYLLLICWDFWSVSYDSKGFPFRLSTWCSRSQSPLRQMAHYHCSLVPSKVHSVPIWITSMQKGQTLVRFCISPLLGFIHTKEPSKCQALALHQHCLALISACGHICWWPDEC